MRNRVYAGERNDGRCVVNVYDTDTSSRPLPPRNDLANHSPGGFQWGYGGSGPAQLALAILADARGDDFALRHYQVFKGAFVAGITTDTWTLDEEELTRILERSRTHA